MMISVHSVMKKRPSPPSTLLHWNWMMKYKWSSQKLTSPHRQQGSTLPDLSPGPKGSTGDDHSYNLKKIIKSDIRNPQPNSLHLNKVFRVVLLLELLDGLPQPTRARLLPVKGGRGDDQGWPIVRRHSLKHTSSWNTQDGSAKTFYEHTSLLNTVEMINTACSVF